MFNKFKCHCKTFRNFYLVSHIIVSGFCIFLSITQMPHLKHADCPWDRLDLLLEKCIIRTGLTWSAAHSRAGHAQTQSFLHQPHSVASFIHNKHMCTHQNMCPCLKQPTEPPAPVGFFMGTSSHWTKTINQFQHVSWVILFRLVGLWACMSKNNNHRSEMHEYYS